VMDLEGALDAQWPSTLDALLVEYAEQRAAELKKTSVAALPVADLFEAQPAAPLSSRPLPSSAPSSADAAAVLDRAPSQLPPAIRTHSGIVAGETGGVRVGEAMTHAARGVCISLAELSPQVLKGRFAILKVLNELIKAARPLVNLALYEHKQELGYLLAHSKGRIFPEMKKEALAASLQQHSDSNGLPGVAGEPKLNITREHRPSAPAAPDPRSGEGEERVCAGHVSAAKRRPQPHSSGGAVRQAHVLDSHLPRRTCHRLRWLVPGVDSPHGC